MGNKPSEYHGATCGDCRTSLPPCKSWDRMKKQHFPEWGQCYNFHNGQYFRPIGSHHRCRNCFYNRIHREERRRQEAAEQRRREAAEAERRRQAAEVERKRQAAEAERKRQAAEAERMRQVVEKKRQAAEAERKRQEEERRQAAEAERMRQVVEKKRQAAEAEKKREEERRQAAEAERMRQVVEKKRQAAEAEQKRQEEEKRKAAEAARKLENEKIKQEKKRRLLEEFSIKLKEGNTFSESYMQSQIEALNDVKAQVMKGTSLSDTLHVPEDETDLKPSDLSLPVIESQANNTSSFQDLVAIVDSGALQNWNEPYVLALNPTIVEAYLLLNEDVSPEVITEVFSHLESVCPPNEILYLTKAIVYACSSAEGNDIKVDPFQKSLQSKVLNIKNMLTTSKTNDEISFILSICEAIIAQPEGVSTTLLRKNIGYLIQAIMSKEDTTTKELKNAICHMVEYFTWSLPDIVAFLEFVLTNDTGSGASKILRSVLAYSIPYESIAGEKVRFKDLQTTIDHLIENQSDLSLSEVVQELKDKGDISPQVITLVEQVVKKTVQLNSSTDSSENIGSLSKRFTMDNALDVLPDILHVLCSVNKDINGWFPRVTQLVSLSLLVLTSEKQRGRLLEIATGEGKSCTVSMFAVIMAKRNLKVDIITSSPVLAERDAEEWASFYKRFNVSIDANVKLSNQSPREKISCYQKDVVYGTVGSFAGDILQQEFSMKPTREGRSFDVVIVDEVDLMTLDQGVQFTYLSHNMVGIRHIEPVLALTWSMISQHAAVIIPGDVTMFAAKPCYFFDAIIQSVPIESDFDSTADLVNLGIGYDLFEQEMGEKLLNPEASVAEQTWSFFDVSNMTKFIQLLEGHLEVSFVLFHIDQASGEILLCHEPEIVEGRQTVFFLLLDGGVVRPLYDMEEVGESTYYMVDNHICYGEQAENKINVPNYLKEYVNDRLPAFIKNALMAMGMIPNREYLDGEKEIYPISFKSSGVIERNKKWGDGLQQFLEMKHFCRLSTTSLVTNFMSNLALFKRYASFCGVSGTLGEKEESAFLQEYYKIEVATIPTHRPKKRFEMDAVFVNAEEEWKTSICSNLNREISSQPSGLLGRAALIICEDIKTAVATESLVKEKVTTNVSLYTKGQDIKVLDREFGPGDVVVATNLAGRGTNIKVTDEVNQSGGLFVLVTFLPMNRRVELQAFGRTARKGAPGSAIITALGNEESNHWLEIKQKRKQKEKQRLVDMIKGDVKEVELQEYLFGVYCSFLKNVYDQYHDVLSEETVIAPLNENWGLWLQRHVDDIEAGEKEKLDASLARELDKATDRIHNHLSPSGNVYHLIKFANRENNQSRAIEAYSRAINQDPYWTAIAYYNRASRKIQQGNDGYMDESIRDLKNAEKLLRNEISNMVTTLHIIKETNPNNLQENALTNDFQTRQEIMAAYNENIKKAISKLEELKSNGDDAIVEESHVGAVIPTAAEYAFDAMIELEDRGLERVYEVKKKPPPFSLGGLIVFLLGCIQVVVGAVLCATGLFASFGLGLITEGVSDLIYGIEAMATGEFSWNEWSIQKAISITVSLVTAGVGAVALKAGKAVSSVIKPIIKKVTTGLSNAWKATKDAFLDLFERIASRSIKQTVGRAGSKSITDIYTKAGEIMIGTYTATKTAMTNAKNKLYSGGLKKNLDPIAKKICNIASKPVVTVVGKEVLEQGLSKAFDYAWDGLLQYLYDKAEQDLTEQLQSHFLKSLENGLLQDGFKKSLLCTVDDVFLQDGEIPKEYRDDLLTFYGYCSQEVAADVASRGTFEKYIASAVKLLANDTIKEASKVAKNLLDKADEDNLERLKKNTDWAKNLVKGCDALYQLSQMTAGIVKLKGNFENFLQKRIESELKNQKQKSDNLPKLLKESTDFKELIDGISLHAAQAYSQQMINVVKNGIGAVVKSHVKTKFNKMTQSFIDDRMKVDAAMKAIEDNGKQRSDIRIRMKEANARKLRRQTALKPGTLASNAASNVRALFSHIAVEINLLGRVYIKGESLAKEKNVSKSETDTQTHPSSNAMNVAIEKSASFGGFPVKRDLLPRFRSMSADLEASLLRGNSSERVDKRIAEYIGLGDAAKALRMSFISTFPRKISVDSSKSPSDENWLNTEVSETLQAITPEDTVRYHQDGYHGIVEHYKSENVIDSAVAAALDDWIERAVFADPIDPEVEEIIGISKGII